MKTDSLKVVCLILVSLLFNRCTTTYLVSKSQEILFQVEYINDTGVYDHWGYYIDVNGDVLYYKLPEKWNSPGDDQTITKSDIDENLKSASHTGVKIPKEELLKYINYIDNIAASKVTLSKTKGKLEGTFSYYCYQYSDNSSSYKRTIIKRKGHSKCENLNFYSKKVVSWLNEIGDKIDNQK
jgi:hypothetical protein